MKKPSTLDILVCVISQSVFYLLFLLSSFIFGYINENGNINATIMYGIGSLYPFLGTLTFNLIFYAIWLLSSDIKIKFISLLLTPMTLLTCWFFYKINYASMLLMWAIISLAVNLITGIVYYLMTGQISDKKIQMWKNESDGGRDERGVNPQRIT